jgi:DNA primase catalytic core
VDDPIQKIKDIADIVELVSEIIPVKRSGASYVAICPFHSDTRPSMHISPAKGIYKCFSCGAGGDVFKFWQDYYQKDFKDTLKDLAEKYGIELNYIEPEKQKDNNLKIQMHQIAEDYYHQLLQAALPAQKARDYLNERGFNTTSINNFKLGFSPDDEDWQKLIKILKEKLQVSNELIESAGLAVKSSKNENYYDRFRGRLMIPIHDERSRPIGFGARILPGSKDDNGAKYINSPETDIYQKGATLFGLDLAKATIRKENAVILVEGFFDLISLHQAGITNVVANQGTALTARQIKQLAKFTESKRIYLCFDSDQAGQNASDKACQLIAEVLGSFDYELRIIKVPGQKDPDEFIKTNGSEAFRELIKNAPLYIDHKIDIAVQELAQDPSASPFEKNKKLKELVKYLSYLNSKILVNEYQKIIAFKLKLSEDLVFSETNKLLKELKNEDQNPYEATPQRPKNNFTNHNGHVIYTSNPLNSIEQELLILALRDQNILFKLINEELQLSNPDHKQILETIVDSCFEHSELDDVNLKFQFLMERLSANRELSKTLAELGIKLEQDIASDNREERYQELIKRIKESQLKSEFKKLKDQLSALHDESPEWLIIQAEKLKIEQEIHRLRV